MSSGAVKDDIKSEVTEKIASSTKGKSFKLGDRNLVGTYTNELGSTMIITESNDGFLKGTYQTAVSTPNTDNPKVYQLVGRYDLNAEAMGWVVSYEDFNSTCAWSGRAFEDENSQLCIHTTWLLSESYEPLWYSTHIGVDIFIRMDSNRDNFIFPKNLVPQQNNFPKSLPK